jgi:GT2 family glycosyltransferase
MSDVPVAAFIPTYNRGTAVLQALQRIEDCEPRPAEILVHVDAANGSLEAEIAQRFPRVRILTSPTRLGPGGGRHRLLAECKSPYAAGFDDDSYPVDKDYFQWVLRLFEQHPRTAILGARIWHRNEQPLPRTDAFVRVPSYVGCGHAVRLAAYRQIRGALPRIVPYGMEENDVALQLYLQGWEIHDAGQLRVLHDTELKHHASAEITAGRVANVALFAFLHYPVAHWYWGLAQIANTIVFSIRKGRVHGLLSGLLRIPGDCYRNRKYRNPVDWKTMSGFLDWCRTGAAPTTAAGNSN